jgi:hypothetical protein
VAGCIFPGIGRLLQGFIVQLTNNSPGMGTNHIDLSLVACQTFTIGFTTCRRFNMSLQSHLSELSAKHQALENQLDSALQHPSMDSVEIARIKRRKLQLKDEIQRIEGEIGED